MFVPGVRRRVSHPPQALIPVGLAATAITVTLLIWASFAPSAGNDTPVVAGPDVSAINSVAYTSPGSGMDDIVVQPARAGSSAQVIASFPNDPFSRSHARGAASPHGDAIAVLWLPPLSSSSAARLSLVDIASRERIDIEGTFDYLSPVAWSADGARFTVTATAQVDGMRRTSVLEVTVATSTAVPVAVFDNAYEVAPVGYSYDGARIYTVVVDQTGSNLYAQRGEKREVVAELSPGRTAFWALSPGGARLAFVDILAAGSRTYVGRTLNLATGEITTMPADGDHFGATWMPGSPLPAFGGPGGEWQVASGNDAPGYLIPEAWSPGGSALVATVYTPTEGSARPVAAIEIITPTSDPRLPAGQDSNGRLLVSQAEGVEFLGWVTDLN